MLNRPVNDSPLRYPWAIMKAALDGIPGDFASRDYNDATSGTGPISPTLGAMALRINAGTTVRPQRDTCSFVFHIIQGSGKTNISCLKSTTIQWSKGDTFAVPAWSHIIHDVNAGEDAYLFALTDRPLLDNLDMYILDGK